MDHRTRAGVVGLRAVDVNRRRFLAAAAGLVAHLRAGGGRRARRILLRSSWQTVNIGDIAPGFALPA
jgi:hypothetical protein